MHHDAEDGNPATHQGPGAVEARPVVSTDAELTQSIAEIAHALEAFRRLEASRGQTRAGADVEAHSMMFWSYEELKQSIEQMDHALAVLRKLEEPGDETGSRADIEARETQT